jgi:pyrimidine operon attenuation protein/uracil phosphoribosyltransferase
MKILNHTQIKQKITRLAYEIAEYNYNSTDLYIAGINNNGMRFARLLHEALKSIEVFDSHLFSLRLNPANPVGSMVELDGQLSDYKDKNILIVDDVANTGRTLFYAFTPFLDTLPYKIQCAVLVDRKHKRFPVQVDFVGLSLATTLKENISVRLEEKNDMSVYLV